MKELDSFTVERLEKISTSAFYYAGAEMEEIQALARIALAAKRAEPNELADTVNEFLTVLDNYPEQLVPINRNSVSVKDLRKALSSTPQLNSPEIPEGWNGTLETAAKLIDLCRTYTILGDSGSYKERTINDCELTMQEIESYLAAAPEKP